jgi:hypothetical protein
LVWVAQLELVVWREYIGIAALLLFHQKGRNRTADEVIADLAARKRGQLQGVTVGASTATGVNPLSSAWGWGGLFEKLMLPVSFKRLLHKGFFN